jgi:hypothetical protein
MTEQSATTSAATAFEHGSTSVVALELSGKGWEVGAVLPGVAHRPHRHLASRDMAGLLPRTLQREVMAIRLGHVCRQIRRAEL